MKIYVVMEHAVIGYDEYHDIMCVCSSVDKAKEAIAEYTEWSKDSRGRHEYNYYEYEVDQIWEQ
jgi:hypothetical protein